MGTTNKSRRDSRLVLLYKDLKHTANITKETLSLQSALLKARLSGTPDPQYQKKYLQSRALSIDYQRLEHTSRFPYPLGDCAAKFICLVRATNESQWSHVLVSDYPLHESPFNNSDSDFTYLYASVMLKISNNSLNLSSLLMYIKTTLINNAD